MTKASCLKVDNNEVLTNESLPLDYTWHSCMYSWTLILEKNILEARVKREYPYTCFRML